ncbi:hypothetical protein K438DRAFT_882171 [Mycena galopus ATCC 62051]|nr:hypothetical protein K438DRAFT_882171 [Mycena galopus ATCC 62051]
MASPAPDAGFFVFPDLSVRREGSYRPKLSLFESLGTTSATARASAACRSITTPRKRSPAWRVRGSSFRISTREFLEGCGEDAYLELRCGVVEPSLCSSPTSVSPRLAGVARLVGASLLPPAASTSLPCPRSGPPLFLLSFSFLSFSPPLPSPPSLLISTLSPSLSPPSSHTSPTLTHLSTESSPLTCSLPDQGIKLRIRKDIRTRKASASLWAGRFLLELAVSTRASSFSGRTKSDMLGAGMTWDVLDACACRWSGIHPSWLFRFRTRRVRVRPAMGIPLC